MRRPGLIAGGIAFVVLSGVLAGACSVPRTPLLTYSVTPGASPGGVLVEGTIALSPSSRCIELLVDGNAPIGLVWPAGYSATFEPLRIYNEAGVEVAAGGLKVTIGGDMLFRPNDECLTATSIQVYQVTPGVMKFAN